MEKHPNRPRVAELLDGLHHFYIPSYQRGYRWDSKQVTDLLNDLKTFATNSDAPDYYLQPLVVRKRINLSDPHKKGSHYEVLDGQQRLTTMLLILKYLTEKNHYLKKDNLYTIKYDKRNTDIDNASDKDADGYYIKEAKEVIRKWFDKLYELEIYDTIDDVKNILFSRPKSDKPTRSARFIWYDLDENESVENSSEKTHEETTLNDIKAFNRLNAGKIGLTSAELIKALFIIDAEYRSDNEIGAEQLALQWDEIERHFEDDELWYFIKPKDSFYQTRIDLLFDFMTNKPEGEDKDYSYRIFQALFDKINKMEIQDKYYEMWKKIYEENAVSNMARAWEEVKNNFDTLFKWYSDNDYFHLIGFLVQDGMKLPDIKQKLEQKSEGTHTDDVSILKKIIRHRLFGSLSDSEINNKILRLSYENSGDKSLIRRILLLHNVETSRHSINSRFSFSNFSTQAWDIEHIDSQSGTTLQRPDEQLNWLRNAFLLLKKEIASKTDNIDKKEDLAKDIAKFIYAKTHDGNGQIISDKEAKDVTVKFIDFYRSVCKLLKGDNNDVDTQSIGNLCLLSAEINRSYKDAPFPIKRDRILSEDKAGAFIPICTRNLFLKYYSDHSSVASTLQAARWSGKDQEHYQKNIIDTISNF